MNPDFLPEQERTPSCAAPAASSADGVSPLAHACRALWLTTLSLMTAHMRCPDRLERALLARRIGSNLQTLAQQECFSDECRAKFARLGLHWHGRADLDQDVADLTSSGSPFWQSLWDSDESRC